MMSGTGGSDSPCVSVISAYAYEMRVYVTPEGRKAYVDKIKGEYAKMGKPEKAGKWNDFSYCVYYSHNQFLLQKARL